MKNFIILSIISLSLIGCQKELSKDMYSNDSVVYYRDDGNLYYLYGNTRVLVTDEINSEKVLSYEKVKTFSDDLKGLNIDLKFNVKFKYLSEGNIFYKVEIRYMKSEDGPEKFKDSKTYSKLNTYLEDGRYPFIVNLLDKEGFKLYSFNVDGNNWTRIVSGDTLLGFNISGEIDDLSNLYFKEISLFNITHRLSN